MNTQSIASSSKAPPGKALTVLTKDNSFRPAKVFRDAVDANAPRVSEYYPHAAPSRPQISSIAFDDSGDSCVTSGEDEAFIIWDARKGTKRKVFYSKKYGISHARFTHRAGNIIHASTKGDDHAIRYHSTHDNRYLSYFRGHSGRVRSLQMRPIDEAFVSAGDDGTVRLWDLRTETGTGLINDLGGSVIAAYDNTGEVIAVACADTQIIMLFNTSAIDSGPFFHGRLDDPVLATISQPPPKPVFTSISFSNNGHYILLGTSSDVHYVLDAYAETVLILRRLVGHRGFEYDRYGNKDVAPRRGAGGEEVGWTGDSKWVVSGSSDGSIVAWDLSPPPGQEKLLPTPDNTLRPTTTLRAADANGGPSRAVRANPRYAMLAVGGDNLVSAPSANIQ
ncbi:hypothetical protein JCM24511_01102 [Saitozyma sp. JCM 24511]|nr:hypothetical protein JCM24511_01102 [Saitozyma sp. JCM 24511]